MRATVRRRFARSRSRQGLSRQEPLCLHSREPAQWHALHRRDERPRATRYAAQEDLIEGFTKKYGVHRLVYYEMHPTMDAAILREKRLKEWRRLWKIRSIESMKPRVDRLVRRTNGRDSRWSSRPVATR
jgi:predicted GIY-YIG superfamily endonuclease